MTIPDLDVPTDLLEPTSVQTGQIERSPIGARAAVVVVVLALVGAGLYGVRSFLTPAGADTSTEAVQQFLDAVAEEDVVGAVELLAPAERRSFGQPLLDIVDELARLEILDPDLDLSNVSGIDIEFRDVVLSSEPLGPGVELVHIDSGRATVSVEPGDLPIGPVITDVSDDLELGSSTQDSEPMATGDDGIVVIEQDGRWYVSMWYSVAELARRGTGAALPTFGAGPTPVGGEDPEAALRGLIEAGIDLDLEAIITMLAPDEAAALYDYSPLFLDEAQAGLDDMASYGPIGVSWGLTELTTTSRRDGDRAVVMVERFGFEVSSPDLSADVLWDGQCLTYEVIEGGYVDVGDSCAEQAEAVAGLGIEMPSFLTDLDAGGMGVVTRQVDGRWYVSPFETAFDSYLTILRQLERRDLDEMVDFMGEMAFMGLMGPTLPQGLAVPGGQLDGITLEGDDGEAAYLPSSTNDNDDLIPAGFGEGWEYLDRSDLDPEFWSGTWWDLDMSAFVRGSDAWAFEEELQVSVSVAEFADVAAGEEQFVGIFDAHFEPTGPDSGIGDRLARLSAYENEPEEDAYGSGQWLLQVGRFVVTLDVYGNSYDEVATVAEAHLHELADHLSGM
ncbi:MAG: hypothetical protein GY929_23845 [Actinomycetia bacterium]|nr:hypothetical protein [Actinomycetes bacterium]